MLFLTLGLIFWLVGSQPIPENLSMIFISNNQPMVKLIAPSRLEFDNQGILQSWLFPLGRILFQTIPKPNVCGFHMCCYVLLKPPPSFAVFIFIAATVKVYRYWLDLH